MERSLTLISFVVLALIGAGLLVNYTYHALGPIKPPVINVDDDSRGLMAVQIGCNRAACEASDTSKTNCRMPSCVRYLCVQESISRSNNTPCKDATGADGVCDGLGYCAVPSCNDVRDNATVCASWICNQKRDDCNILRDCGTCTAPQTCAGGRCEDPASAFIITLAEDAPLMLDAGHSDLGWGVASSRTPSVYTGFNYPLMVQADPVRLMTGQEAIAYVQLRNDYATGFKLDDPMHPVIDSALNGIAREGGDYLCHGPMNVNSFVAAGGYQFMTHNCRLAACAAAVVMPSGVNYDLGSNGGGRDPIVYGIAYSGAEAYAVLNNGLIYLTGITPRADRLVGGRPACSLAFDAAELRMCLRKLFTSPPLPASAPQFLARKTSVPSDPGYGPKAVFGDNFIALFVKSPTTDTSTVPYSTFEGTGQVNVTVYTILQPGAVQTVTLPYNYSNAEGWDIWPRFSLYGQTLPQGKFIVVEGRPINAQRYLQIFKLVGSGATARLENVTRWMKLPETGDSLSAFVSIDGEPILIEFSRGASSTATHAYMLRDLSADPIVLRDVLDKPPVAFPYFLTGEGDALHSIASYSKDGAAYLYLRDETPLSTTEDGPRVWKLVRKT